MGIGKCNRTVGLVINRSETKMFRSAKVGCGFGLFLVGAHLGCGGKIEPPPENYRYVMPYDGGASLPDAKPHDVQPDNPAPDAGPKTFCFKFSPNFTVDKNPSKKIKPSITSNGGTYGVTWADDRHGDDEIFFGSMMSNDVMQVIHPGSQVTANSLSGPLSGSALFWGGEYFGIIASGASGLFFNQIDQNGLNSGEEKKILNGQNANSNPALAISGDRVGLVWNDYYGSQGSSTTEINYQQLSKMGGLIGDTVRITNDEIDSINTPGSSIVAAEDDFALAWFDAKGVYFKQMNKPTITIATGDQSQNSATGPSLAWNGNKYVVAWSSAIFANVSLIHLTGISKEGTITDEINVTETDGLQNLYPVVHWSKEWAEFGLTWISEFLEPNTKTMQTVIDFARFSENLELKYPGTISIDQAGKDHLFDNPQVSSAKNGYGIVWGEDKDIRFAFIDCSVLSE